MFLDYPRVVTIEKKCLLSRWSDRKRSRWGEGRERYGSSFQIKGEEELGYYICRMARTDPKLKGALGENTR